MRLMTKAPALALVALLATPALAEDPPAAPAAPDDGFSLMEEGMKLILRGFTTEMEPTLNEMEKALDAARPALESFGAEIGPRLQELVALIDDIGNYDAPVMLPNGDILIRRNAPLPPKAPPEALPEPGANGEIEL
jgi:hypothetical protein